MNVLLINDSSSNPNWGDRAAAISLKRMIIESGATIKYTITEDDLRNTRFFLPISETVHEESRDLKFWIRMFLPPVVFKLQAKLLGSLSLANDNSKNPIPETIDGFDAAIQRAFENTRTFGALLKATEQCDVVVIHGDGAMVGNGIIPRTKLFLGYLMKKRCDIPVLLVNHTTDFDHPDLFRIAKEVYPLLDDVTYRDQTSEKRNRDLWAGRYAADTAFIFTPATGPSWLPVARRHTYFDFWPDEASFDPASPYICIGGSSIFSYSDNEPPRDLIGGFMSMIRHLQECYRGQIVLTVSDRNDEAILRPVARDLELPLIGLCAPVQQVVDVVGNAQAYVGGRWHVSIFALSGGTPVIPLSSKTFKMPALIEMAGLPTRTFDALNLYDEKHAIGETLATFVDQGESLRASIREWAQQQAVSAWDNISFLARKMQSTADTQRGSAGVSRKAPTY